LVEINLV